MECAGGLIQLPFFSQRPFLSFPGIRWTWRPLALFVLCFLPPTQGSQYREECPNRIRQIPLFFSVCEFLFPPQPPHPPPTPLTFFGKCTVGPSFLPNGVPGCFPKKGESIDLFFLFPKIQRRGLYPFPNSRSCLPWRSLWVPCSDRCFFSLIGRLKCCSSFGRPPPPSSR